MSGTYNECLSLYLLKPIAPNQFNCPSLRYFRQKTPNARSRILLPILQYCVYNLRSNLTRLPESNEEVQQLSVGRFSDGGIGVDESEVVW